MSVVKIVILFTISFVFESTFLERISLFSGNIDLILVFTILLGLFRGEKLGGVLGLLFGLVKDLFFSKALGIYALVYASIGFISGQWMRNFNKESFFIPFLTFSLLVFFKNILFSVIYFFLDGGRFLYYFDLWKILGEYILNLVVFRLLYFRSQDWFELRGIRF